MIKLTEHHINEYNNFAFKIMNPYDDCDKKHCSLNIKLLKHSWWFEVPQVFKPKEKWVDLSRYEWATPNKDGRKGYIDSIRRSYGFNLTEESLHIDYGIQPMSWSSKDKKNSDHTKVYFLPWNEKRRVRHDFFAPDGTYCTSADDTTRGDPWFESIRRAREITPTVQFKFNDYDGEEIIATCQITEMEWRQGVGLFKWLGYIMKPIIRRDLDIQFNKEVGYEKCSWKGGTMGHSIEMLPGETALEAFKRYGSAEDKYKHHGTKSRGFTKIEQL